MNATVHHRSVHVDAADLLECTARCPVCHDASPRNQVYRVQRDPDVWLLRCEKCKVCSASHMPRGQVLGRLYQDYYNNKGQKTTIGNIDKFARHIMSRVRLPFDDPTPTIVDFGGGDGSLAVSMAQMILAGSPAATKSVRVIVVDFHEPASSPDPRVHVLHTRELSDVQGTAQIVVASAILEHIPDCNAVFRRLFDLVAPGGYFYSRTPWALPLRWISKNLDITYPFHVHDMGGGFWNRIIETFAVNGQIVTSGPSPPETSFLANPVRTIGALVFKTPARLEKMFTNPTERRDPTWNVVGGWEVLLQLDSAAGRQP
jgi:hypothetical protein